MTNEPLLPLMISQRDITTSAARRPAASVADQHRRIAAAILKKNDLLPPFDSPRHFLDQSRRKRRLHQLLSAQFAHIFDKNLRHLQIAEALMQLDKSKLPFLHIIISLHRRRRRAQQHLGAAALRQDERRISRVVARSRVLLFVRSLVLLINDD